MNKTKLQDLSSACKCD